MSDNTPIIELKDVEVTFTSRTGSLFKPNKVYAVRGVNMRIERGQTLGIVGESGCGKSTTANVMCGLQMPTKGKVFFNGKEVTKRSAAARREIGRVTMENLVADGRIHPARIEEMFGKAEAFVNQRVQEAGEQATFDTGIHDLHPELVRTLGRLRYRTSYGQNVLNHSLEVAYLSGVMASELGLDPIPAKRAGLLHDLGKAVDHEVEGSHAVIGADLARRFGERPEIVHAIEAHHNDVEPSSVLAVLVQAADAVSAARPGARKETLDAYVKRLEKLEEIASSYKGVERTYAIQAGREVRVMVEPDTVDEAATTVLAHDIAQRIENEMQYPGQVKVVVIRESRAVGVAK